MQMKTKRKVEKLNLQIDSKTYCNKSKRRALHNDKNLTISYNVYKYLCSANRNT